MKSPTDAVISDFSTPTAMSNFRVNADKTLSKRDGYYKLGDFGKSVRGAYAIDHITYTVVGNSFYKLQNAEFTLIGEMSGSSFADDEEKVSMFCNADILYIIGGGEFYYYNILEDIFSVYQTYAPLILKNATSRGSGEAYEAPNILSANRRVQYNIETNMIDYYFPEAAESITAVYLDDVLISPDLYQFKTDGQNCYIRLSSDELTLNASVMVVEFFSGTVSENIKKQYLSNVDAFIYSDEDETRLFLYGKNTNGKIMLAVDRNNNSSPLNPSLDYIPDYSCFSLIDGNRDIYKIIRYNNAVIAITSNGTHQILKRLPVDGDLTAFPFYSKILSTDFSTTEKSGIVIADEVCYSFSNDGLISLSYSERYEAYSVKKLEIPEYMRPSRNLFSETTLHFNKIRNELWCCSGENIAVYNIRHNLWYKFTGITADYMFIADSQTAFSYNGAIFLFDEDIYTDNNEEFDAVYESCIYDLGNIFKSKTVFGFGAVIENIHGTSLNCTLKNDKDAECNILICADCGRNASKFIKRVHTRLGACYYVTLRMESPAGSPPANVKSIMFRYR